MAFLKLNYLRSGGIITNYYCVSQCRHCLYNCSPRRKKEYLDEDTTRRICRKLKEHDCLSVHVGGGEPFLDIEGLFKVLAVIKEEGISVDYVETNAAWYTEGKKPILEKLKEFDVEKILISISPFHNEYITFAKTKKLIDDSKSAGLIVFPWIESFFSDLDKFDEHSTHSFEEYKEMFGSEYVSILPNRYWIHYGGRAIKTFSEVLEQKPVEEIIEKSTPCLELENTSHFHMDLFGNYVPGLCSGLAIDIDDLGKEIYYDNYPLISILFEQGIKGLYKLAVKDFGFVPDKTYLNKCHICTHIRKFLLEQDMEFKELSPAEFYMED